MKKTLLLLFALMVVGASEVQAWDSYRGDFADPWYTATDRQLRESDRELFESNQNFWNTYPTTRAIQEQTDAIQHQNMLLRQYEIDCCGLPY